MLFGIDKWPAEDGWERDRARPERDGSTNESKTGPVSMG